MAFKSIKNVRNWSGRTVLVRVDFNVPLEHGQVADEARLRAPASTIDHLVKRKAKVVLLSHLGRPASREQSQFSLRQLISTLEGILNREVAFCPESVGPKAEAAVRHLRPGQVLLLENLRFQPGEERNGPKFTQALAKLGEVYVNDALSVSHRAHASVVGLPKLLPHYAGLHLAADTAALERAIRQPKRPVLAIIGGAKISDKLGVIQRLLQTADAVLTGGGVANALLAANGSPVGKSLVERGQGAIAKRLLRLGQGKLLLPHDVVVDSVKTKRQEARVKLTGAVRPDDRILDLGVDTVRDYAALLKRAKTVVWSGPLGVTEQRRYSHATLALAELAAARAQGRAYVLVGGGDTLRFFHQEHLTVDYECTAGSAMLAYLAGEKLPGLVALAK